MDRSEEKQNERCTSRGWCKIIQPTKQTSHNTSEIVAYHKVKRKFLSLRDMEKEDPNEILICEFKGQDFEFIED